MLERYGSFCARIIGIFHGAPGRELISHDLLYVGPAADYGPFEFATERAVHNEELFNSHLVITLRKSS
jgi:hypothetical protein